MGVSHLQRVSEEDRKEMVPFRVVCDVWLNIHPNTGYKLRKEDQFPVEVITLGGRFFCRRADLERYAHREAV